MENESEEKNIIRSLYPTTKIIFCISFVILAFILPTFVERLILLGIIYLLAIISGKSKLFFQISLTALGILMVFIMMIQSFFYQGENPTIIAEFGIFSIKYEGIINGLNLASSVLVFASAILLFFQTTRIKDFIYALETSGMNPKASYVVLATIQMIPQMYENSKVIMNAQKARGVETEGNLLVRARAFLPILSPLVLSSIAATEEKALTLEARGFSAPVKKTQLMEINKQSKDKVLSVMIIVITVIIVGWRIVLWVI